MFFRNDFASYFRRIPIRNPIELRHQFGRPDVRRGISMAFQAKRHVQRLILMHFDHLIDTAVAAYAAHTRRHVRFMIEEDVIRQQVNMDPRDRLAGGVALPHQIQTRTGRLHLGVTIHARLSSRDRRIRRLVHRRVTI